LRKTLRRERLDGLLVMGPANRRYLTGFTPDDGQPGESSGAALVSDRAVILATDARYALTAESQATLAEIHVYSGGLAESLPGLLERAGVRRLGFEAEWISVALRDRLAAALSDAGLGVELIAAEGLVEQQRRLKDRRELALIREAVALTETAFQRVYRALEPGRTERQVAWEIEKTMRELGADDVAFPPIVAAGSNAAEPHAEPTDRPLQSGEPVLFDLGARYRGYRADMSRTVILGEPDDKFKEVYAVVRRALGAATDGIRPGMDGAEADALAREVITEAGWAENFGHALGHGVGLATHESPSLSAIRPTPLLPGMVFTIEPGVYLPGWGGVRLEQMVVLEESGVRVLNRDETFYEF
ncbi:MAG: aminopeptidase P family protein, partial [Proteobacteria bacterium]|nr:aminopeptidase P family protein [Pseudomonadota bacterium]